MAAISNNQLDEFFLQDCSLSFVLDSIHIYAPDALIALGLRKYARDLARWAKYLKKKWTLIFFPECGKPYQIPAVLAMTGESEFPPEDSKLASEVVEGVFATHQLHLPLPLLKRMLEVAEDERPCCIVRVRDSKQIVVNQPMVDLLETPPEDCVERILDGYWRPRDLEIVKQRYRQESSFNWDYDAALNPHTWAKLEAYFERFEVNGEWYSFNRNMFAEPIATPNDVRLPVA
ncbi:hypothetical protein [Okeania sp. SIO2B3]|uniref:hypothetical protein n=1 Tax=Okeania sp. SIO2B3 TaxID=2607784 RepID=UPI0013C00A7A|nr:hypothetical protein [Okeania sp. SIO2B3]NET46324.1 hypothetical protein [Okeania sp. SIO2B3]